MAEVQKSTPAKTPGPVINKAVKADHKKAKADQDGVGKKPVQKVAEKAAEKVETKAKPEKSVPTLPWRENSCLRALYVAASEGKTEEQLKRLITSEPYNRNWDFMKKTFLKGYSGTDKDNPEFTFKVNRDDGKMVPYDLKPSPGLKKAQGK